MTSQGNQDNDITSYVLLMHVLSIYLQRSIDTTNSTEEVIECELIKQLEMCRCYQLQCGQSGFQGDRILGLGLDL